MAEKLNVKSEYGHAGKGSTRRPTDENKFRKNFDSIDWRRKECVENTTTGQILTTEA